MLDIRGDGKVNPWTTKLGLKLKTNSGNGCWRSCKNIKLV